ncbi:peptidoglycan-binding protein [Streptomyces sp. NPDC029674]|uniref:peptidoglycan-binding protein n=1 Tax=Streptomyces sp. NPDC029674 TaxID=3365297 RepID=UPI00385007AF
MSLPDPDADGSAALAEGVVGGAPVPPPHTHTGTDAGGDGDAGTDPAPELTPPEEPGRNRRLALAVGAGAVAAVAAVTVFAMGLLSSAVDGPARDRALPGDPASAYADPTKPAPPSAKRSGSVSPPGTPSVVPRTPSARNVAPPPSPTPTRSAPSPTPTVGATGTVGPSASPTSPPRRRESADATLREGDRGARVAELQDRLAQLYLYVGDRDGTYTSRVTDAVARYQWARGLTDDARGEYGRETRRSLESETREP